MTLVELKNVSKNFGATEVLKDVTWQINSNNKIGLVGDNGSGKSTLFRIITGEIKPDTGIVRIANNVKVAYLPQDTDYPQNLSVKEVIDQAFSDLVEIQHRMEELEKAMESADDDSKQLAHLVEEYGKIQEIYQKQGGYTYKPRLAAMLDELDLTEEILTHPIASLSGGEKARVELAKALLQQAHLLLLDEPDNHLDADSLEWLLNYLETCKSAFVLVSHNRFLLDQVVEEIAELEECKFTKYYGNYSEYTEKKKQRLISQYYAYISQKREIERLEKSIETLRTWSSEDSVKRARQAESMQKRLNRMELIEKPILEKKRMKLEFELQKRSGEMVVQASHLTKRYGDDVLFAGLDFDIRWGEHIALLGPNGCGKTTLIKIILGLEPPTEGEIKIGEGLIISYFDQEQGGLDPERSIYDELIEETELSVNETRYLLVKMLFPREEAFKKVKSLSGGERNRIILSKLAYSKANFMVMDEPNIHLDISSVEVLESTLAEFPGTLLLASHDRYLLSRVTDRVFELKDGTFRIYPGGYGYYLSVQKDRSTQI